MASRPRFPARAFIAWLAVVADVGGTGGLFVSGAPLALKVAVGALEAIGFYTIVVFYLGRRREWARLGSSIERKPPPEARSH